MLAHSGRRQNIIGDLEKKFKRDNFYQSKSLKHFKVKIIFAGEVSFTDKTL